MERWKDINGYEGKYQVSNFGRIKSLINNKGIYRERILKPNLKKHGYLQIALSRSSKQKHFRVHRLVAEAFIPNPLNYSSVNHKDEDRTNNKASNLEWCTVMYNNNYGNRGNKISNSLKVPVKCITTNKIFNSLSEAAEYYKINKSHISSCCTGKRKSTGMYKNQRLKWEYVEEEPNGRDYRR